MILLCGLPWESPLERVGRELAALGAEVAVLDQRELATLDVDVALDGVAVTGTLAVGGARHTLADVAGVYVRAFSEHNLPQFQSLPVDSPLRARTSKLFALFHAWCEVTPARVVNRMSAMGSNASKPYQAERIRAAGFLTPETLITNDPEHVLAFRARHPRLIYKSLGGTRSIVSELDASALARLELIRWCPVQFQALVEGTDVRVHVVGEETFATAIKSTAIDYRYAGRQDGHTELSATTLADDVAASCIALARDLRLPVCGVDLRIARDGGIYCFEVNPSPGFSYYEANTGQPIANAIARYLLADC